MIKHSRVKVTNSRSVRFGDVGIVIREFAGTVDVRFPDGAVYTYGKGSGTVVAP